MLGTVRSATLCPVTIDHAAPEPVYQQLATILRDRIRSGELASRAQVPSLRGLAAEHGLAVTTVQKALQLLKDEGLIAGVPGRGMYVR